MYNRFIYLFILINVLSIVVFSDLRSQALWSEISGGYTYRLNDFYIQDFHNYQLYAVKWKVGFKKYLNKPRLSVHPYFLFTAICDYGKNDWNKVDWHNHRVVGYGLRLRYNPGKLGSIFRRELNIDLFLERHYIHFKKYRLFYTGHRPNNDLKTGFQYWCAYSSDVNKSSPSFYHWTDNAGALYYSRNTFFVRNRHNFYLLNLYNSTGFGFNIPGYLKIELYWTGRFCYDFGTESHNNLHWHNNFQSGPGCRFKFEKYLKWKAISFDMIVIPFFEFLWIAYPQKVDYIPGYRPASDIRTGIELWLAVY